MEDREAIKEAFNKLNDAWLYAMGAYSCIGLIDKGSISEEERTKSEKLIRNVEKSAEEATIYVAQLMARFER